MICPGFCVPSTSCARVMLVLFCSSVLLKKHDVIPFDEATFYVFTAVSSVCVYDGPTLEDNRILYPRATPNVSS